MLQLLLFAIAGATMSVSGSAVTWDFTINPDGSGKVVVTNVLPPAPPEAVTDKGAQDILGHQFLRETLFRTGGVDVWADVSMDKRENGEMPFKGTAYFPDVAKVGMGPSRDGQLKWSKDTKGAMVLSATAFVAEPPATPAEKTPALSDEEIAKRMADLKQKFKDRRESLAANLGRMKVDLIYRLPGTVTDVTGFTQAADGSLHWTVSGAKLLEAYDKSMADDAFVRQCVVDGKSPLAAVMAKEVPSALSARATGDLKPQFDYAAEVKAAKEAWPALRDKLGLVPPPGKGEPAKTGSASPAAVPAEPAAPK